MARFNLDQYETVDDRLHRFWTDHPDGRVDTMLVSDPSADIIVFRSEVWREYVYEGQPPAASGYAREVVGDGHVNQTAALENCETSAIGRALANLGYSPKGRRPSREEMSKAEPEDDVAFMYRHMRYVADETGDKGLAKQLWADAASVHGLSVGDVPDDRSITASIYGAAMDNLREMRKMKAERFDKANPEGLSFDV